MDCCEEAWTAAATAATSTYVFGGAFITGVTGTMDSKSTKDICILWEFECCKVGDKKYSSVLIRVK